jgi:hypothetical protein
MSRIVDIRHGRVAMACVHPVGCEAETVIECASAAIPHVAEIILFPRIHRSYEGRPRKRVTRRFDARRLVAAE